MNVPSILVICTANRCRSQMAEGWLRHLGGDQLIVCSGGVAPRGVHPMAVETMKAVGIDISRQTSDGIDRFAQDTFDLVVTLCGKAHETCPAFPGARSVEHCPFDDPDLAGLSPDKLAARFERIRDEIGDWAQKMVSRMTTTIPQEQTP